MRIAWYVHRYFPCVGGSENFVRAMASRFAAEGAEVEVFTTDALDLSRFVDPAGRAVEAPEIELVDGVRVRRFSIKHMPVQRYLGKLLSFIPNQAIRCRHASYMPIVPGLESAEGRFDVVFGACFPYTIFSFAALKTARASNAPLALVPFLHLANPGDPVRAAYTKPHQIRLLKSADGIASPTNIEIEFHLQNGIPRERILHLPMGFDFDATTRGDGAAFRKRYAIPLDRPVVGQLGALDLNKGTNDLVAAIARLNAKRSPEDAIELVLAGSPTPRFREHFASLPDGEKKHVLTTGILSNEHVCDFYKAIDVYAMPSRTDSFGIVFLEAWANAKPVVAAAAGGVVEVVQDGETGLLVPFGDVEKLAGAIGGLIDDPERACRLGRAGCRKVATGCSWDDRFRTLANWTAELIDRKRAESERGDERRTTIAYPSRRIDRGDSGAKDRTPTRRSLVDHIIYNRKYIDRSNKDFR